MPLTLEDVTITGDFTNTMTDADSALARSRCIITDNATGKNVSYNMPCVPGMQDYAMSVLEGMVG